MNKCFNANEIIVQTAQKIEAVSLLMLCSFFFKCVNLSVAILNMYDDDP